MADFSVVARERWQSMDSFDNITTLFNEGAGGIIVRALLDIYDAPMIGDAEMRRQLSFSKGWVTAGDVIRRRIEEELADAWPDDQSCPCLTELAARHGWLVAPPGDDPATTRDQVMERQVKMAFDDFKTSGFIMLVNDHQVTDLRQAVDLNHALSATFIRLMPLAGG